MHRRSIHVIGAGPVGALTTIYLAQKGFSVFLFERNKDVRKDQSLSGRSINLAVTSRGLKALEEIGIKEHVLEIAIPMKGRMLHAIDQSTSFVPYGQSENEVIHSVSRIELNQFLLRKASTYENVKMHFEHPCTGFDLETKKLSFLNILNTLNKGEPLSVHATQVIGTDGSGSLLRKTMAQRLPHFQISEDVLEHGYKELTIPAKKDGGFLLEKNALHIWPRKSFMLIALPNLDGSFTATLFFPHKGAQSFETLKSEDQVLRFFKEFFPDVMPLMPDVTKQFFENPTGSMTTIRCFPWHIDERLMLLGDAAHAIVPFFGQGMNCGFEDASQLGDLLKNFDENFDQIFSSLEKDRKPNADAIAQMALDNFMEMRDTVTDPKFSLKKQIGFELEKRFPKTFIPKYAMVVFHPEISYAEARSRGEKQDVILNRLSDGISSLREVDWNLAASLLG